MTKNVFSCVWFPPSRAGGYSPSAGRRLRYEALGACPKKLVRSQAALLRFLGSLSCPWPRAARPDRFGLGGAGAARPGSGSGRAGKRARRAGRRRRAAWCIQTPETPWFRNQPSLQRWTASMTGKCFHEILVPNLKSGLGVAGKRTAGTGTWTGAHTASEPLAGVSPGKMQIFIPSIFLRGSGSWGWEES